MFNWLLLRALSKLKSTKSDDLTRISKKIVDKNFRRKIRNHEKKIIGSIKLIAKPKLMMSFVFS